MRINTSTVSLPFRLYVLSLTLHGKSHSFCKWWQSNIVDYSRNMAFICLYCALVNNALQHVLTSPLHLVLRLNANIAYVSVNQLTFKNNTIQRDVYLHVHQCQVVFFVLWICQNKHVLFVWLPVSFQKYGYIERYIRLVIETRSSQQVLVKCELIYFSRTRGWHISMRHLTNQFFFRQQLCNPEKYKNIDLYICM
jgi:hypothetical protein